jgi:hypothetical protein
MPYSGSNYAKSYLSRRMADFRIKRAVDELSNVDFDTIAFRGNSGACFAPIIAHLMGKKLILVRKSEARGHSAYLVEGETRPRKYIIMDDFIAGGNTWREIHEAVEGFITTKDRYVGTYLYDEDYTGMSKCQHRRFDPTLDLSIPETRATVPLLPPSFYPERKSS